MVVTQRVHPEVVDLLAADCEVVVNPEPAPWPEVELLARLSVAEAMLAFMPDRVDAELLASCPRLRIVAGALKGADNFDVDACTRAGVWVSVVPDLLTAPTAELAVGLLLGVSRHLLAGDRRVRSGQFRGWRPVLYGTGLAGSTVGLYGLGAIGRAIARRLAGFEPTVLYTDRRRLNAAEEEALGVRYAAPEALVARSDFLVLGVPLTGETLHLVDRDFLARMRPGAYLVNPCRGSTVNEAAVAQALESGHLAGYAADVFEMEDWAREDRPRGVHPGLLAAIDRTLLTPHLGSAVADVRRAIELEAARNVRETLAGRQPPGAINRPDARAVARKEKAVPC